MHHFLPLKMRRGSLPILIAIVIMGIILLFTIVIATAMMGDRTGVGAGTQNPSATSTTGGLCSSVPPKYQTIFDGAASSNIPPAMLAAVFSIEHGSVSSYRAGYTPTGPRNASWPEKDGDPNAITRWQTSSAGAEGPMQFTPGTWSQYGGGGNVQNISSAMSGTARMMQANYNSNGGSAEEKLKKAIARYNPGAGPWNNSWYVDKVWANYVKFNCGVSGGIASGGSIVDIARSQIGVKESGGKDCGVGQYTGGHCEMWCADFVSWVYNKAGYNFTRIAGARNLYNWFNKNQLGFPRGSATPQPGDVIYYTEGHVGIVEFVDGHTVHTIEGNVDHHPAGYNGSVQRETHNLNDSGIGGYGRWKQ